MVRRIDYDRFNGCVGQIFNLYNVVIADVTEAPKFISPTPSFAEELLDKKKEEQERKEKSVDEKIQFLDEQLKMENERIEQFKKLKAEAAKQSGAARSAGGENADEKENEEAEDVEFGVNKEARSPKHQPGGGGEESEPTYADMKYVEKQEGYQLREGECLYKIQGTAKLDNRSQEDRTTFKACYFAAIYAVMNALTCSLKQWDYRRVDRVIENASELFNSSENKSIECSRKIKDLVVDHYKFSLKVNVIDNKPGVSRRSFKEKLMELEEHKKYFILQISNGSFAIYKDEFYHIFDPYATMEKIRESESDKKDGAEEEEGCPEFVGTKASPDQNTASWVLLPTKEYLFKYIEERAASEKWDQEYLIHIVDILRYKKLAQASHLLNFLCGDQLEFEDEIRDEENLSCLKREKMCWLEMYSGSVPWSRTKTTNIKGVERSSAMVKAFFIEFPGEIYSLWGTIHPRSDIFKKTSRGKQCLAADVIACCMANVFRLQEWNPDVIDAIIKHGNEYFMQSIEDIKVKQYELLVEDLNTSYEMEHAKFNIHIETVVIGQLYNNKPLEFNLSDALAYFFQKNRYGILQCMKRHLAFGKGSTGYFLFDCHSYGQPVFGTNEGVGYVLMCSSVQKLLYCMVLTLQIPYYNVDFFIHKVTVTTEEIEPKEKAPQGEAAE